MVDKFIDDHIEHIEEDIEKIQVKPSMYISYLGSKGALHLCKEAINNAIDECINTNSVGDTISILFDEPTNTITVSDNGRGIDPQYIEVICTTLQSGSKFTRNGSGGNGAGENGVGLTACNALSERFEIIVYRYGKKTSIGFVNGKLVSPLTSISIKDKEKHGSTFIITPSRKFMGDDCDINSDDLLDWIEKIVYLVPERVGINISLKKKGKEIIQTKKYRNKRGLYDYVKKLCAKPTIEPIHFIKTMHMKEKMHDNELDRAIGLEVAFTYNSSSVEFTADSFCNFVNTIDNGVHVDAVRLAIVQYIGKEARARLNNKEQKSIEIIPNDIIQGLVLTVYLNTTFSPMFTGQTKEKVGNDALFKPIRSLAFNALVEYFNDNSKELKKICDRVKLNAKARIESTKVRNSIVKRDSNRYDEYMMDNFEPANNRGKNQYRELFIIEGRSAKGSASSGRFDRDTQAIFTIRGVPLNTSGTTLKDLLNNEELKSLIGILGCGVDEDFDITKLEYNKIIIMADSDSDGYNITSLMCLFFMVYLRPLVEHGYIYKAVAPLYELRDKNNRFIRDKKEYIEVYEKNVRKHVSLYDIDSKVKLNDKEVQNFLLRNRMYYEELARISNHVSLNPIVLEYIIIHRHDKDFMKRFHKRFGELTIEDGVVSGIYEGKYQIAIMDNLFDGRVSSINSYINDINHGKAYYLVKETSGGTINDNGIMSIGEFMEMIQKYQPVIITRFKGLGELEAEDLRDTTLDPNNRLLIRMTTNDMERDMDIFDLLHGDSTKAKAGRQRMMRNLAIKREDLDN